MFKTGDIVELKAISKHGKDRIAQHGKLWIVKKIDSFKSCQAVLLESSHNTFKQGDEWVKDGRWVRLNGNDPDFEISLFQGEEE